MVTSLDALRSSRDAILAVASRRGARSVRVFGSVARGDAIAGSDVDLLVAFEAGRSLLDQVHLIADLEQLLGKRVDVVAEGGLLERDGHILSEAVPLWLDPTIIGWPTSGKLAARIGADYEVWAADEDLRLVTERLVEIIGEAARAMTSEGRSHYPEVDWTGLIGLRTVLVHAYHRVQPDLLWQAASVDVPALISALNRGTDGG